MMLKISSRFCLFLFAIMIAGRLHADNFQRSPEFQVPDKLRPRVNFWKDIFTRYGKAQFVIHHRHYPQITFMVVDLSSEYQNLGPSAFASLKKNVEKERVAEVREAVEYLANGAAPKTFLQKFIAERMQELGSGSQKYRDILEGEDIIRTQTGIKEKFAESVARTGRYLPIIEKIFVNDFGLPIELTRIPYIESSFDYTAYSSVGAAGIWQFMPRTAKIYMRVNSYIDERRDPLEASRAAAKYLRDAYKRLGYWPLAITSYNHGIAGVAGKVKKSGTSDLAEIIESHKERYFGFASSNFYPEFLAALDIHDNYTKYFPGLKMEKPIRATEVQLPRSMSVREVVNIHRVPVEDLKEVNYAISKAVWNGRVPLPAGYRLKVPSNTDLHNSYLAMAQLNKDVPAVLSEARPRQNVAPPAINIPITPSTIKYSVKKGDTLIAIAKKFGVSVDSIKRVNRTSGKAFKDKSIKAGQVIEVPTKASLLPEKSDPRASMKAIPIKKKVK